MSRKILFIEQLGSLVKPPAPTAANFRPGLGLAPNVIAALLRFHAAGYEFVALGNRVALEESFPDETPEAIISLMTTLFASQAIDFSATLICPHPSSEACNCRLPQVGLLQSYLGDPTLDRQASVVVGASNSSLILAANIGIRGFLIDPEGSRDVFAAAGGDRTNASQTDAISWRTLAHRLLDGPRTGQAQRKTRETEITIRVDLDREAEPSVKTGIGFFDHMLEQLGKHGGFALQVDCQGDLEVDEHHTVEDVALTLGQALANALGDKRGIERFGFLLPMDEAAAEIAIDLSGRAYFVFEGEFPREQVGALPTELVPHFFRSLSDALGAALHIRVRGDNTHHMVEACFKGVARALRQACKKTGHGLPSTKGQL